MSFRLFLTSPHSRIRKFGQRLAMWKPLGIWVKNPQSMEHQRRTFYPLCHPTCHVCVFSRIQRILFRSFQQPSFLKFLKNIASWMGFAQPHKYVTVGSGLTPALCVKIKSDVKNCVSQHTWEGEDKQGEFWNTHQSDSEVAHFVQVSGVLFSGRLGQLPHPLQVSVGPQPKPIILRHVKARYQLHLCQPGLVTFASIWCSQKMYENSHITESSF